MLWYVVHLVIFGSDRDRGIMDAIYSFRKFCGSNCAHSKKKLNWFLAFSTCEYDVIWKRGCKQNQIKMNIYWSQVGPLIQDTDVFVWTQLCENIEIKGDYHMKMETKIRVIHLKDTKFEDFRRLDGGMRFSFSAFLRIQTSWTFSL